MNEETITPSLEKHYLTTEPFFISSADGRQVEILRPANFDPVGETK